MKEVRSNTTAAPAQRRRVKCSTRSSIWKIGSMALGMINRTESFRIDGPITDSRRFLVVLKLDLVMRSRTGF